MVICRKRKSLRDTRAYYLSPECSSDESGDGPSSGYEVDLRLTISDERGCLAEIIELGEPAEAVAPGPPPSLDEVSVTITGPKSSYFFLDNIYFPENRGFTDWEIKDNPNLPSDNLSLFFDDNQSERPDSITSTAGMALSQFYKFDSKRIFCEIEKDFVGYSLDSSVTITFTIRYF